MEDISSPPPGFPETFDYKGWVNYIASCIGGNANIEFATYDEIMEILEETNFIKRAKTFYIQGNNVAYSFDNSTYSTDSSFTIESGSLLESWMESFNE